VKIYKSKNLQALFVAEKKFIKATEVYISIHNKKIESRYFIGKEKHRLELIVTNKKTA
jgi:hypothetical protein